MGYEPDLGAAVETFSGGRLSFNALGIGNPFSGIWLKAAQEPYDRVGGSITSLPERTRDAQGRPVIRFGVGHISFSQSLLVRAASAIERHAGPAGDGHRREQRTGCLQLFRHACRQRAAGNHEHGDHLPDRERNHRVRGMVRQRRPDLRPARRERGVDPLLIPR